MEEITEHTYFPVLISPREN